MSTKQIEALKLAREWIGESPERRTLSAGKMVALLTEALAEQPAQQGCMRCNTPKKCALHGCSPLTWPAEQPAQQEPVAFSQFLSDVVTAAGLLSHGKTDKSLAARISEFAFRLRTSPQTQPLTDEQIDLFINGRGDEGDDDYVEPTGDGFGLTDADLVRLVRRVEAVHGIKGDA